MNEQEAMRMVEQERAANEALQRQARSLEAQIEGAESRGRDLERQIAETKALLESLTTSVGGYNAQATMAMTMATSVGTSLDGPMDVDYSIPPLPQPQPQPSAQTLTSVNVPIKQSPTESGSPPVFVKLESVPKEDLPAPLPPCQPQLSPLPSSPPEGFKGTDSPILAISSDKVFKGKKFTVYAFVGSTWRNSNGLSKVDVTSAVLQARACKEADIADTELVCPTCANVPCEIACSSAESVGPDELPNDVERYTFDSCMPKCSSSRDHLKSKLVFVVDTLRGAGTLVSPAITLQAREKTRRPTDPSNMTPEMTVQHSPVNSANVSASAPGAPSVSASASAAAAASLASAVFGVTPPSASVKSEQQQQPYITVKPYIAIAGLSFSCEQPAFTEAMEHVRRSCVTGFPGVLDFQSTFLKPGLNQTIPLPPSMLASVSPSFALALVSTESPENTETTIARISKFVSGPSANPASFSALGIRIEFIMCTW